MATQKQLTVFQHYLPQTWLKRFTYNENRTSLYVYNTEKNENLGSKNIKGVAGEEYFYDFHQTVFNELVQNNLLNPQKDQQLVETQFFANNIENKLGILLKNTVEVLDNSHVGERVLDENFKLSLTIHFAIQYFRGLFVRQMTDEILGIIEEIGKEEERYKDFEISAEEELTFMHFLLLRVSLPMVQFASNILSRPWVIFKAQIGQSFVISDNPFVINSHGGMKDLCIPISKDYLIVIYNRELPKEFDLAFIELKEDLKFSVTDFNYLQYQQSYQEIYSYTDDFSWINQKIKKEKYEINLSKNSRQSLKNKIKAIMERKLSNQKMFEN